MTRKEQKEARRLQIRKVVLSSGKKALYCANVCIYEPCGTVAGYSWKTSYIETADKNIVLADYIISAVDTMKMFYRIIGK